MKKNLFTIVVCVGMLLCVIFLAIAVASHSEDQRIIKKHYSTNRYGETVIVQQIYDGFGNLIDIEECVVE